MALDTAGLTARNAGEPWHRPAGEGGTMESETALEGMRRHIEAENYYEIGRLRGALGAPSTWSPEMLYLMLHASQAFGRSDLMIADCLDNPGVANLREFGKVLLAFALAGSGRGELLLQGRVPLRASADEPGALVHLGGAMAQGGDAAGAARMLAQLGQRRGGFDDVHRRHLIYALVQVTGKGDVLSLGRTLRGANLELPPEWLAYESLRHAPESADIAHLPNATGTAIRREKHVPTLYLGLNEAVAVGAEADSGFQAPPRAIPADLTERVRRYAEAIAACCERPAIRAMRDQIARVRERFAPSAGDPIQVISTGRAGTTALFAYLDRLGSPYMPFHSFSLQVAPRHRWGAVTRLLSGDTTPESLGPLVEAYLRCRIAEMAAAYRENRTPVVVSHWDAIFAPVWATLFDDSRLLYLRRNEGAVIRSMIGKRQYGGTQIAALPYAVGDDGGYRFDLRTLSDLPYHVGWFLAFTERFWEGLEAAFPNRDRVSIQSERLFEGDPAVIDTLHAFFDRLKPDREAAVRHFGQKINEKTGHSAEETDIVRHLLTEAEAAYAELAA